MILNLLVIRCNQELLFIEWNIDYSDISDCNYVSKLKVQK